MFLSWPRDHCKVCCYHTVSYLVVSILTQRSLKGLLLSYCFLPGSFYPDPEIIERFAAIILFPTWELLSWPRDHWKVCCYHTVSYLGVSILTQRSLKGLLLSYCFLPGSFYPDPEIIERFVAIILFPTCEFLSWPRDQRKVCCYHTVSYLGVSILIQRSLKGLLLSDCFLPGSFYPDPEIKESFAAIILFPTWAFLSWPRDHWKVCCYQTVSYLGVSILNQRSKKGLLLSYCFLPGSFYPDPEIKERFAAIILFPTCEFLSWPRDQRKVCCYHTVSYLGVSILTQKSLKGLLLSYCFLPGSFYPDPEIIVRFAAIILFPTWEFLSWPRNHWKVCCYHTVSYLGVSILTQRSLKGLLLSYCFPTREFLSWPRDHWKVCCYHTVSYLGVSILTQRSLKGMLLSYCFPTWEFLSWPRDHWKVCCYHTVFLPGSFYPDPEIIERFAAIILFSYLGVSILTQRSLKGLLLSYCFLLSDRDCSNQFLGRQNARVLNKSIEKLRFFISVPLWLHVRQYENLFVQWSLLIFYGHNN